MQLFRAQWLLRLLALQGFGDSLPMTAVTILFPSVLFSAQGWYLMIFPSCVSMRWSALDAQVCVMAVFAQLPKSPLNRGRVSAFGLLICKVKS